MSSVPLINAKVTAIAAPGQTERYRSGPGAPTPKWAGSADAYAHDELREVVREGNVDQLDVVRLTLPLSVGLRALRGDLVTFQRNRQEAETRVVRGRRLFDFSGLARLEFWEG